uniref:F-box domain-containing protein n=1 Tax=Mycena chlorophos TaxID=658473 RepID=A0ABQ0KZH8_MYCCL|nr:predicted protein [Mycena chlorophos]
MVYKLPAPHTTITSLEFSEWIEFATILDSLMQMHETLRCLALVYTGDPLETESCIQFPRLEELRIGSSPWHADSRQESILWNWSVPNLQRLWLHGHQRLCQASLSKFGANITFLFLTESIPIDSCPKLQHLAVNGNVFMTWRHHSTLECVDIWSSPVVDAADSSLVVRIPDTNPCLRAYLPALRKCRIFDATFIHYCDLSVALPPIDIPSIPPRLGEFDFDTTSGDHKCDSSCSLRKKFWQQRKAGRCLAPWWVSLLDYVESATVQDKTDPGEYVEELDGDSRYDPRADWFRNEEIDGGSSSDSESEDSEGVEELNSDGEDWEIGREEALEIFSRIISK